MSTIKLLTGQILYETARSHQRRSFIQCSWEELVENRPDTQEFHNQIAKRLNQELGLCEECGERPIAPNGILEVAGNRVCFNCCTPSPDMHFILDAAQNTEYPAQSRAEIAQLFKQHVPIWSPEYDYAYYQIRVFKNSEDIGRGWYRHLPNGIEVFGECGAAYGLADALKEAINE